MTSRSHRGKSPVDRCSDRDPRGSFLFHAPSPERARAPGRLPGARARGDQATRRHLCASRARSAAVSGAVPASPHRRGSPQDETQRRGSPQDEPRPHDNAPRPRSLGGARTENCVEVAGFPGGSAVRDTQNRGLGHLEFPGSEWAALLSTASARDLQRERHGPRPTVGGRAVLYLKHPAPSLSPERSTDQTASPQGCAREPREILLRTDRAADITRR
ncbi:DUF397 domain-containing protein [Nocardiopsis sp. LOL_012]|uniref:DUF397 domain-containing protein n=1 Tax=Nocardiopsis sp. LOL_012 TaxID=3345409 RepID=UPI003A870021